jgi:molecular chaperone GrpE
VNEEVSAANGENPDDQSAEVNAATPEQEVSQLREALEAMRQEIERNRDEALRARAEMDNARKRAQRDVEAAHKFGIERLVEALVPVKDSLDLGLEAAQSASDIKTLQEGMALTQQMFQNALDKLGVTAVNPAGARFDPAQHQAMMMEVSTTVEPGTVLRVLQQGYSLHERLIRPAMVIVAKAPEGT